MPLPWYLLQFGSLKPKGELLKRFSFPSDKIFLFLLEFSFFARRNKFLRIQFCNDPADPVRIAMQTCIFFALHKDSFFSELCVPWRLYYCLLPGSINFFKLLYYSVFNSCLIYWFNSFRSVLQANSIHLHLD